jgi:hypothetical protein
VTDAQFELWWSSSGQFVRAGGGEYEKSFAYELLRTLRKDQESRALGASARGYLAGDREFLYPAAGDPSPPGGAKVHLLTPGGICVDGGWKSGFLGWASLPRRNKEKERLLKV